jgi:uncharacterized hydrophobic protein (TIGR00271 family)
LYKKVYLVSTQDTEVNEEVSKYLNEKFNLNIQKVNFDEVFDDTQSLFLLNLNDDEIKQFFKNHVNSKIHIAILPNENCQSAINNYSISKSLKEAIDDAFNEKLFTCIDVLMCNDTIAFNKIEIGNMHGINGYGKKSYINSFKSFYKNLKNISFKPYTLTTSKEHSIKTVASGIIVLEHSVKDENSALKDDLSLRDGKLNAFILSPSSLISYFTYLITIFFYHKISVFSLPKSLGFIKSSSLNIKSKGNIDCVVDGVYTQKTDEINIDVLKDSICLHLGRSFESKLKKDSNQIEEKDTIKVNYLPKGELKELLLTKKLYLFKKASEDDFKDLFLSLNSSAKFSYIYLTLMILSTLVATTGLFANSTPVIIGAMILAPLMSPIISLSMGVIRANNFLISQSIKTLLIGIIMALFVSSLFTFLIPLEDITNEMKGRLHPNLLDLFVAVFSGIAGAYASAKEEVAKSLAGVAIAVALVPPLSVTGIGIGFGDLSMIYGSFLLFITNLVGITLSAALTFIILGYSPIKRAKKGLFYTGIMMVLITIPLLNSFNELVVKNEYLNKLEKIEYVNIENKTIHLEILDLYSVDDNIVHIDLEVTSDKNIGQVEYKKIKSIIDNIIEKDSELSISTKIIVK